MTKRSWLPSSWIGAKGEDDPFGMLRKQIDTLFDDFDVGGDLMKSGFAVRTNLSETDDSVCVTAELPGIGLDEVDLSVAGNRLTVKGEKKSEKDERGEEDGREFHRVERRSGAFMRTITLPFDIDSDTVAATAKDGVLTITVPKPADAVSETRKIEINRA
ncbi:Hsp20/alpha crystallin family protein [Aliiruegeria sabulilitoris]|uniref:Hsp20/alpha crystallin family protein n=1 Tax=Aliiruegeria sabulilitoris TaxID=1510458 RepID=UPI00082F20B0|nr:Hsp20/alpha crystallin family protein [Aliiruegeria sabulilitoris]NDR58845.1 Hsp20/alpha crystallin family protein [Pseudoruegeria sp. M32A2M]